jgi:uncharacterized membrane protein
MALTSRTLTVLGVLLLVSLAGNFFLAGVMASHMGRPELRVFNEAGPRGRMMLRGVPALTQEGAKALRDAMREAAPRMRAAATTLRDARVAVRDKLTADPFDAPALAKAQADVGAALVAMQAAMSEAVEKAAATLSKADREALARLPLPMPSLGEGRQNLFFRELPGGPAQPGGVPPAPQDPH